jgi:hypothetical protein
MTLVAFGKNKPTSQKPTHLEVTYVGQVLLSISILCLAIIVVSGEVIWPVQIPPGWELEWVDDDAE